MLNVSDATDIISFTLPEDRVECEAALLAVLKSPGETFIECFDFSLGPLLDEIAAADAAGVPIHILADYREFNKPTEKAAVNALAAKMKHGEITLACAADGPATYQIEHQKTIVAIDPAGGAPLCWMGSTNLSAPAFNESNDVMQFRSQIFATAMIERFMIHRVFCWQNKRSWQIMSAPPADVDAAKA